MSKIALSEIAARILRGGTIDDKLFGASLRVDEIKWSPTDREAVIVDLPGRMGKLKPREASERFPKHSELRDEMSARGRLLHFFANHELLAIETMALTLLKFHQAPLEFLQGLFKTLQDEQRHFKLYQARMRDYGVEIGDFALNLYFWNTLKTIQTPLDFVTRMSLTFEQANLDFALEYASQMRVLGDEPCAALLQEVHDDEIKHVKHGLKWFQEWRGEGLSADETQTETEWQSFVRLLPYPMTPRRAKGKQFSETSRLAAGLSSEFIKKLKIAGGSRGRAPDLYFFNPQCELEFTPELTTGGDLPRAVKQKIADLEPLLLWLAKESDAVMLGSRPPQEWLEQVHELKGELPEILLSSASDGASRELAVIQHFKPWGWSPSAAREFAKIKSKVCSLPSFSIEGPPSRLSNWYSKAWWQQQLAIDIPESGGGKFLLKRARSTSGRGHQVFSREEILSPEVQSARVRGDVVIEPFLYKMADFSTQIEIFENGEVKIFEPRFFKTDSRFQYQGAYLGLSSNGDLTAELVQFLKTQAPARLRVVHRVVEILKQEKYVGPVGIDGLIYRDQAGESHDAAELKIHAAVEVNVRLTMGRVAIELERVLSKKYGKISGFLHFYSLREIQSKGFQSFAEFEKGLNSNSKTTRGQHFLSTTPAATSQQTWTMIELDAEVNKNVK